MKFEEIPRELLTFKNTKKIEELVDIPLIISEKDLRVLFGNSFSNNLSKKCIAISEDYVSHIEDPLYQLEEVLVEEHNLSRIAMLEKELNKILKEKPKIDELFEFEKETRTVEEVEFQKPDDFKYKPKRKKGEDNDSLFSCFGE